MKHILPAIILLMAAACSPPVETKVPDFEGPTMGWSSWNTYAINISDTLIMRQADAMVSTGLAEAGYKFINIDDGYFGGRDAETGQLLIHPTRFPSGVKPVVDYIHSLGLKAGIYSDAGANTCGNYWNKDTIARNVGLLGHEQQDADFFFKEVGFDFIKVDFCGGTAWQNTQRYSLDPEVRYKAIRAAIDATGRKDVRLNICRWDYPGTWVDEAGFSWRISHDIASNWPNVRDIIRQGLYLSAYAGPGHYNDMDMLEVGRTLSQEEDRTHLGIWCMMASPLLIGCDMTSLRPETLELLLNRDLIAIDQDPAAQQAYVVDASPAPDGSGLVYVLVRDLLEREGTQRAVAFYNPSEEACEMSIALADLSLAGAVQMYDVFAQADVDSPADGIIRASVPAHGCRIYRLQAETRLERTLYEAETAYLTAYQELYNPEIIGSAYYIPNERASGQTLASHIGGTPLNDLRWREIYAAGGEYDITIKYFTDAPGAGNTGFYLAVNGEDATFVRPETDEITLKVTLQPGRNEIRLYNDRSLIPAIDYMTLEKL